MALLFLVRLFNRVDMYRPIFSDDWIEWSCQNFSIAPTTFYDHGWIVPCSPFCLLIPFSFFPRYSEWSVAPVDFRIWQDR